MGLSKEDVALRSGSVVAPNVDINILVLGEASIGKSYMIQAYVGNRIPTGNEVPDVHPVYRMTPQAEPISAGFQLHAPSQNTRVLIDTDGVRLGASMDDIKGAIQKHKPDVIVLCYSQDEPMSIARLAQHWLPAIRDSSWRAPSWPYIPVVLAGLRNDQLDTTAVSSWLAAYRLTTATLAASYSTDTNPFADDDLLSGHADELAIALSVSDLRDRIVENLMISHSNVMATINVSAAQPSHSMGLLGEIGEVWDRAVDQVLYPVFPIFNTADTSLTMDAALAFSRIFRIVDGDNDGVLGVDEFQLWQTWAFGYRVSEQEVRELFTRLATDFPEGVTADASCLNEAGFRHVLISYIFGMATDSVWTVLHAFGYRWGMPPAPHGRLSLELGSAAQMFVSGPDGPRFDLGSPRSSSSSSSSGSASALSPSLPLVSGGAGGAISPGRSAGSAGAPATPAGSALQGPKRLYLHMPDSYVTLEASTPDGGLVLSGTLSEGGYAASSPDRLLRSELRRTGLGFVCRLFKRFATGRNRSLLLPEDVRRMFEITPSGSHPFGPLYPDVTTHAHDGGIALTAWINLWQMLLTCSPAVGLASLYQLGFTSAPTGSAGTAVSTGLDFHPRKAVEQAGPRKSGGDYTPAPVRRMFVMGSAGSGKTSLILHSLNGPGSLRDRTAALSTFSRDERPGPLPTSLPTHYVAQPALPDGESRAAQDAMPYAVVLTEWPADAPVADVLYDADSQADALVLCVDPCLPSSVAYFRRLMDRVPDRLPTVVVATNHERNAGRTAVGFSILSDMCRPEDNVDLIAVPPGPPGKTGSGSAGVIVAQKKAFLAAVAAAAAQLEEGILPSTQYALDCRGMAEGATPLPDVPSGQEVPGGTSVPGLALEVFKFGLKAKHESTVELFKYVTAVTLRHGLDNPKTRARRSKERLQALLSFTVRLGTTAVVVAALTGVGLYVSDYRGSRAKTHDAVEVVVRRVKEVVLGAGASGSNGAGKAAQR